MQRKRGFIGSANDEMLTRKLLNHYSPLLHVDYFSLPGKVGTNAACNYRSNLNLTLDLCTRHPIRAGRTAAVWNTKFAWHFYIWATLGIELETLIHVWSLAQCPISTWPHAPRYKVNRFIPYKPLMTRRAINSEIHLHTPTSRQCSKRCLLV